MRLGFGCALSLLLAASAAHAQEPEAAPPSPPPPTPPPDLRQKVEAGERDHVAGRSPEHLFRMASAYAALAESGGDPWDARLAVIYFERYLATRREKPTRLQQEALDRLRAIAGWRGSAGPERPGIPSAAMHFVAYDRDHKYQVDAGGMSCMTPCSLTLPPGLTTVEVSGAGDFETDIVVPKLSAMIRLQHERNGMRIAGGVLIPVGVLMASLMWMIGLTCDSGDCAIPHLIAWPVLGGATMITGIVLLAAAPPSTEPNANRVEIIGARSLTPPVPALHVRF